MGLMAHASPGLARAATHSTSDHANRAAPAPSPVLPYDATLAAAPTAIVPALAAPLVPARFSLVLPAATDWLQFDNAAPAFQVSAVQVLAPVGVHRMPG